METLEAIAQVARRLTEDHQRAVLAFCEFLGARSPENQEGPGPNRALQSPAGLFPGLVIDLADEEFDEIRRDMWGPFPRGES
ncbi:MAG: hypothetical protein HY719_10040 [Planctomycetes bacterium]|nr:hypothetical protein [Planctomycetota bacterium]